MSFVVIIVGLGIYSLSPASAREDQADLTTSPEHDNAEKTNIDTVNESAVITDIDTVQER